MEQTHDKCRYYGYKKCPEAKNDIMLRANQEIPELREGEERQTLSFPTREEINNLCRDCLAFIRK